MTDQLPEDATPAKKFVLVGEPWERQPGETSEAYQAFKLYRDMGVKRSNAKVAKECGKNVSLISRWSSRWHWVRRIEMYDIEQDRLYQAELGERRKEMATRHAKQATMLQTIAIRALKAKFGENFEKLDANSLKSGEVLRWFIDAAKMERTALGEPGEIIEQQHTGGTADNDRKPAVPLTYSGRIDEALALLEAVRARAADGAARTAD